VEKGYCHRNSYWLGNN